MTAPATMSTAARPPRGNLHHRETRQTLPRRGTRHSHPVRHEAHRSLHGGRHRANHGASRDPTLHLHLQ